MALDFFEIQVGSFGIVMLSLLTQTYVFHFKGEFDRICSSVSGDCVY